MPKGASVNGLVKALPKLLKAATEAVRDGDEEKAFVFYMKYMEGFQVSEEDGSVRVCVCVRGQFVCTC